MIPGGALYSLTTGGAPRSKLILSYVFNQQTPMISDATFGCETTAPSGRLFLKHWFGCSIVKLIL